jgi:hypothetical protein
MKKSATIKFLDNQIKMAMCFRQQLLDNGTLTLTKKDHYETIDHFSTTLVAIKMILIAIEKEKPKK